MYEGCPNCVLCIKNEPFVDNGVLYNSSHMTATFPLRKACLYQKIWLVDMKVIDSNGVPTSSEIALFLKGLSSDRNTPESIAFGGKHSFP